MKKRVIRKGLGLVLIFFILVMSLSMTGCLSILAHILEDSSSDNYYDDDDDYYERPRSKPPERSDNDDGGSSSAPGRSM